VSGVIPIVVLNKNVIVKPYISKSNGKIVASHFRKHHIRKRC
jgi:hypothetical protein